MASDPLRPRRDPTIRRPASMPLSPGTRRLTPIPAGAARVPAESNLCLVESNLCLAESNLCLAEPNHCLAKPNLCLGEANHCLAESADIPVGRSRSLLPRLLAVREARSIRLPLRCLFRRRPVHGLGEPGDRRAEARAVGVRPARAARASAARRRSRRSPRPGIRAPRRRNAAAVAYQIEDVRRASDDVPRARASFHRVS